jgi:hypothetical protein
MTALIWFNEDGVNPEHQMVQDYGDAPRVYVFDLPYLQEWQISKHRVQFIYEALLEIPEIRIFKGETVAVLKSLVNELGISEIVTTETPNHMIKGWQSELRRDVKVVTYAEDYPVVDAGSPRSFSRYWNKGDRQWLTL